MLDGMVTECPGRLPAVLAAPTKVICPAVTAMSGLTCRVVTSWRVPSSTVSVTVRGPAPA